MNFLDKILLKFFSSIDSICDGLTSLFIAKPKQKLKLKRKKCKKCHHNCHCNHEFHADEYGVCTCETCKC